MGYSLGLLPGPHDPSTQRLPRHVTSLAAISHSAKPSVQPNLRSTKSSFPGFPNHLVSDSWGVGNREADACTATPCATTSGIRSRISCPAARAMSAVRQPTIAFVDAVIYRYRTGIPWRDLPERYGHWKAVHTRYRRWCESGVFMWVFELMSRDADNEFVMLDATIVRAHQHSAGAQKKTPRIKRSAARVAD